MRKIIDMSAPCDCGWQVRHDNGGNYHPRAMVFEFERGDHKDYAVVLTDTRCRSDFGDRPNACDECGLAVYEGEQHFHITRGALPWVPRLIAESWCSTPDHAEEESEEAILLTVRALEEHPPRAAQ
jgi:hypothetical protein